LSVALDANLLLYASDRSSDFHERATQVVTEYATGDEIVYLFWPVAMAYLRIATHPGVFESPLSPQAARDNVASLVSRRNVRSPGEGPDFWRVFDTVAARLPVRGNLVPDAHVVALMRQYDVKSIVSHDRDFRKFDGIETVDPFV
jgi:toxin-antitoxin system PIN domain toxin